MSQTHDLTGQPTAMLTPGSFTARRVERILQIAAGAGSLVVGTQAFVATFGSVDAGAWHAPLVAVVFTTLAAMLVSLFVDARLMLTATAFVCAYTATLLVWPVVTAHVTDPGAAQPWIWYVTNVATLAAALIYPLPIAVAFTIGLPVLFFIVRMIQVNWTVDYVTSNLFDLSFALCLGGVVLLLIRVMRAAGRTVDRARAEALDEYARAAAAEAVDAERLSMAALMHDSVMAALIAAARAESPREQALTVAMARDALTALADAEADERMALGRPVSTQLVARDLARAAEDLGSPIEVAAPEDREIPGHVARALTLAGTQAITNAVRHAHGLGLSVTVTSLPTGCRVEVSDAGAGIDLERIPEDRLGIRASIFARLAAVGGRASIDSHPGHTSVTMEWAG